jgi:hypothetical protein
MQGITLTALWRGVEDRLGSVPQIQVLVAAEGLDPLDLFASRSVSHSDIASRTTGEFSIKVFDISAL